MTNTYNKLINIQNDLLSYDFFLSAIQQTNTLSLWEKHANLS